MLYIYHYLTLTWINLSPVWISDHIPIQVWDEIIYPFLNFNEDFNGCTIEIWEFVSSSISHCFIGAII